MKINFLLVILSGTMFWACQSVDQRIQKSKLFTLIPSSQSQVDFSNDLKLDDKFNIYTYRNFYNGGGVGLGDINNDGLIDLYLTANMKPNKLYLNKGNFEFEDITSIAGVSGKSAWSTGVSMADVDGDGWLDIYICNSGDVEGDNKQNELFINNGDNTFSERGEEFGIADKGFSTHGAFFDFDKDGDLDLYLLNNSFRSIGSFNLQKNERPVRDQTGGDKLYRNDGNRFIDISEEAGIFGSVIGFGLGVTVGDIDQDGWLDIYISNDFFERDYIYMNNGDGTFKETLETKMKSISAASMGADMADINNDGYPELFVTEMLPSDESRLKTVTTFENWDRYQYGVNNGYHHQFTRNTLQLNNSGENFSEIGRLAGVAATDWSWGALILDFENDGFKDIFVTNGIYKDLTNQDYIRYVSSEEVIKSIVSKDGVDYKTLIDAIPSNPIPNFAFVNDGLQDAISFTNQAAQLGLGTPSHSNGSAYGDLDNDGDLDLVVNNVNTPLFIYRNESNQIYPENNYLKVILKGTGKNTQGIGAKLIVKNKDQSYYLEQIPTRGFQSSIDSRPNFGLGSITRIDSLIVEWPDGKLTKLADIATNTTLTLDQRDATIPEKPKTIKSSTLFTDITDKLDLEYQHIENNFIDFDRDRLIFHMLSNEGPKICKGDVNKDGREDFFIGGAKDSPGALFIQQADGSFQKCCQSIFEKDKISEDADCLFFDADNDNDLDLYVASGGNEFPSSSSALLDRLYINDGTGVFSKSTGRLPATKFESTSSVKAADFDGDGDLDLFIGIRLLPFLYGVPASSYIYENDGTGKFENVTEDIAPGLLNIGMTTDALWADIDNDQDPDLIIVGEWMPIKIFENRSDGKLVEITKNAGLAKTNGWWNSIEAGDFDKDGDIDFVIGNHGLNSRFKASPEKPVTMHINDFDHNGTVEQIISTYNGDKSYPMILRHDLVMQIPGLKKRYSKYESYKEQTIEDIFSKEKIDQSTVLKAHVLETSLLINNNDGTFELRALPSAAQYSPVYGLALNDFDKDGHLDMLVGGNFYRSKPEVGIYDASYGLFLKGDGRSNFKSVMPIQSGFLSKGEIRDIVTIKSKGSDLVLIGKSNSKMQVFKYNN